MACRKKVELAGGFVVEVRSARKQYICFYCRKPIQPSEHYVVIRVIRGGSADRYHLQCFNTLIPHRLRVVTAVDPCLESVLADDSVF